MSVINWANQVNKKIIDSTKIVIGENGFVDNESDSKNFAERYLTSISSPDTLNVVMDFDWSGDDPIYPKDENGYTEFDRFVIWYKFEHKRGVNPFWFPAITKFNADGSKKIAQYKIISALSPEKSGFSMRVSMTWKEVYTGAIEIPQSTTSIDSMICKNGRLLVTYTDRLGSTKPTIEASSIKYRLFGETNYTDAEIDYIDLDGKTAIVNFQSDNLLFGTYEILFSDGVDSIQAGLVVD